MVGIDAYGAGFGKHWLDMNLRSGSGDDSERVSPPGFTGMCEASIVSSLGCVAGVVVGDGDGVGVGLGVWVGDREGVGLGVGVGETAGCGAGAGAGAVAGAVPQLMKSPVMRLTRMILK